VARTWLQIRVELEGGRDVVCDPPPGRIFIVGLRSCLRTSLRRVHEWGSESRSR
jgi:hypothetical protein